MESGHLLGSSLKLVKSTGCNNLVPKSLCNTKNAVAIPNDSNYTVFFPSISLSIKASIGSTITKSSRLYRTFQGYDVGNLMLEIFETLMFSTGISL